MDGADPDGIERRFERRTKAAIEGRHLPTEEELLRGMPFMSRSISIDAREYAERLLRHLKRRKLRDANPLGDALEEMTIAQDDRTFRLVLLMADTYAVTSSGIGIPKDIPVKACQVRCQIYLAHLGEVAAVQFVASELSRMAHGEAALSGTMDMAWRALGWTHLASRLARPGGRAAVIEGKGLHQVLSGDIDVFRYANDHLLSATLDRSAGGDEAEVGGSGDRAGYVEPASGRTGSRVSQGQDGVVVLPTIGNMRTNSGREVAAELADITGKSLPLPAVPDLLLARERLLAMAPHAAAVIDRILADMRDKSVVAIRPTVLVGEPGCGKSFLAKAIAETIGIASVFVSCGGATDSAIGGTSRRWTSAEPCLPLSTIRLHRTAGPLVILDEVEKVSSERRNGAMSDVLVGMLGDESARRYYDPYVEAEIDLSHVNWIMTANDIRGLHSSLLDRCRILQFPQPGPEHTRTFANRFLVSHHARQGLHPGWAPPLDPAEIDILVRAWQGGSLRRLKRLVEGVVTAREQSMATA